MPALTVNRISGQPSSSALFRGCKETGGWCLPVLQRGVSSPLRLFSCNSWPHCNCFYLKWSWQLSRRTQLLCSSHHRFGLFSIISSTRSLRRVRRDVVSPHDTLRLLKQPRADTRSAVRSADYMWQTLRLLKERKHHVHKRSLNATGQARSQANTHKLLALFCALPCYRVRGFGFWCIWKAVYLMTTPFEVYVKPLVTSYTFCFLRSALRGGLEKTFWNHWMRRPGPHPRLSDRAQPQHLPHHHQRLQQPVREATCTDKMMLKIWSA